MSARGEGKVQLDPRQLSIVQASAGSRLLVEAAPGCGKTHVACARVASLLERGVSPDALLLVSFTRTAVHELRNRIATLVQGGMNIARGVEIRTIDSLAWRLATGAEEVGALGSYQDSIREATEALRRTDDKEQELKSYLQRFSHVLVDEAQDLVGPRAILVIELLNRLRPGAGWTVFLDPAQAIYGWSAETEDGENGSPFQDMVGELQGPPSWSHLSTSHRTSNKGLLKLMSSMRQQVLAAPSGQRLQATRKLLDAQVSGELGFSKLAEHLGALGASAASHLVLYRRRVDALTALSYLREKGVDCRLRLGGLPRVTVPWLSVLAARLHENDIALDSVSQGEVVEAWNASLAGSWLARGISPDEAWALLHRVAPAGKRLDMKRVAARLATRSLPDELCPKELGSDGAILGTIHGSKGREASHVLLCYPDNHEQEEAPEASDEEARVLYVAASRAVHSLEIRRARSIRCGYSGERAWRASSKNMSIELGRDGDVDAIWPMLMASGGHAASLQARLAAFDGRLRTLHVKTIGKETSWTRHLELETGEIVGALSRGGLESLQNVVSERAGKQKQAPLSMRFLTWLDVTTVAVRADDERALRLPAPWRETRLLLAPVIAGMGQFHRYW